MAIDTGDMVLVRNDLSALLVAVDISRITFRRIKWNYFWALFYNASLIPVAAGTSFAKKKRKTRINKIDVEGLVCRSFSCSVLVQCVLFHVEWCIRLLALVFFYHDM